jgi:hypothetical protein
MTNCVPSIAVNALESMVAWNHEAGIRHVGHRAARLAPHCIARASRKARCKSPSRDSVVIGAQCGEPRATTIPPSNPIVAISGEVWIP